MGPDDLAATRELRALVEAYGMAVDERDEPWFASLWLPGAELTVHQGDGPAVGTHVAPDFDHLFAVSRRNEATFHPIASHRVLVDADGTATGVTYCSARHLRPVDGGGRVDVEMTIRYIDRYGRDEDGRWRFAARQCRKLWSTTHAVDP